MNVRLNFYFDNVITCTREPDATYYTSFDDDELITSQESKYYKTRSDNGFKLHSKLEAKKRKSVE